MFISGLLIFIAGVLHFYGSVIANGSLYFYYYFKSGSEVEISTCKLQFFDGWIIKNRDNKSISFVRLSERKLNHFWVTGKYEDIVGLESVLLHGHKVIGRVREIPGNKFDLMYYFPDYKIKVSFANQGSRSNQMVDNFAKNLICRTV